MKKVLKLSFALFAVVLIAALSVLTCFAKGVCLVDNDITVGYKDTFTYTLYLSDCEKPVTDMVAHIFYDSKYLKLDEDSVSFHDLMGVSRNLGLDGHIPFTFSSIGNPIDFSKRTPVVSLDFKVLKEGKTSVEYFITDLDCGSVEDPQPVKDFTFSCDYVVHSTNGDESFDNRTPVLLDDADMMNEYQGSFVNYKDGKGEQSKTDNKEHVAVTGESQGDVIEVTRVGEGESSGISPIVITIAVIVIVVLIVIIVIIRRVVFVNSGDVEIVNAQETEDEE